MPATLPINALTDLARTKRELEIDEASTTRDTLLLDLIGRASSLCEDAMGGRFLIYRGTPYTEFHSLEAGRDSLWLLDYPVFNVVSVHEDVNWDYGTSTELLSTNWVIRSGDSIGQARARITRRYGVTWMEGTRAVRVIYKAGFASLDTAVSNTSPFTLPTAITDLCTRLVAIMYREVERKEQGAVTKTDVSGSTVRFTAASLATARITPEMRDVLAPYSRLGWETGERDAA